MTKQELNRYFWLKHEIKRQMGRMEKLQQKLENSNGETVGDTVRDYRSGKGIPVRIEGVPKEEFSLPIMIRLLEEEIAKNIKESEEEVVKIESYIQSVEDPRVRELLRCRYLDCMSWKEIGASNYIHADAARKIVNNFIKESNKYNNIC